MAPTSRPVIGILTDFGLDGAVAACKGVILSICPEAQIVDIAHTMRKYAIGDGARLLAFALPYLPVGAHVGVVDPGVGTERRAIGIRTGRGDALIGPDNGLLLPAADLLGGAVEARELTNRDLWLPVATSTFHGRDIFSPVAAHLSAGVPFETIGDEMLVTALVRLPEVEPTVEPGRLTTTVTYVDSFGNIRIAGRSDALAAAFGDLADGDPLRIEIERDGDGTIVEASRYATTFGRVPHGASLVYLDSQGQLSMADNQGNLAARLGIVPDLSMRIERG